MTMATSDAQERSALVRRRRAGGYLAMSALLPGSVQLFTGARRIGRAALNTWLVLCGIALLIALGLLVWRGPTIALLFNPVFLLVARVLVWVVAVAWIVLLVDAWRRSDPMSQTRRTRLVLTILVGLLSLGMIGVTTLAANALAAIKDVSVIFDGSGRSDQQKGRYNILLLGADSGPTREGMRPDTIMVASIDATTGKTVLFSLPRNLEGAPFPETNPLHKLYPNGYDCPKSECLLNGVYTLANEHKDLFPGVADPGLKTMTDVVGNITGLTLNYYALVDLGGFEALINAVGGIRLDIGRRIPIGGIGSKIYGYIEPGKNQLLDGYHALWFARSRADSDDYDRMTRQKCVLNAMVKQLDPLTVATKFNELASAGSGVVRTSVPAGDISKLIDLALIAKNQKISSVSFAPPLINPGKPDVAFIRSQVATAIANSESGTEATPTPAASEAPAPASTATAKPSASKTSSSKPATVKASPAPAATPTTERATDDLGSVCSVSQ